MLTWTRLTSLPVISVSYAFPNDPVPCHSHISSPPPSTLFIVSAPCSRAVSSTAQSSR